MEVRDSFANIPFSIWFSLYIHRTSSTTSSIFDNSPRLVVSAMLHQPTLFKGKLWMTSGLLANTCQVNQTRIRIAVTSSELTRHVSQEWRQLDSFNCDVVRLVLVLENSAVGHRIVKALYVLVPAWSFSFWAVSLTTNFVVPTKWHKAIWRNGKS